MFDNTKFNIILLCDHTEVLSLQKNLGSHQVASCLRKNGYEVQVLNHLHIFTFDEIKKILSKLISDKTLYVGFSTFFYKNISKELDPDSVPGAVVDKEDNLKKGRYYSEKELGSFLPHGNEYNIALREHILSLNPNCKLVLGGSDSQDDFWIKLYDYAVFGYGDNSAVALADHLAYGKPLPYSIRSLNKARILDDRLATTYNFVESSVDYLDHDFVLPGETMTIEVSRGCIFKCAFCTFPMTGKKKNDYIKHKEVLRQEFLNNYNKHKIRRYLFSDDTFNDTPTKVRMIKEINESLPFDLEYWAYIRLDLLAAKPQELIDELYESGCRATHFGIETMNHETAKMIGKGGSRQKITDTLNYIKEKYPDMSLNATFIFGLPNESVSSMKQTVEDLRSKRIKLDSYYIYPLYIEKNNLHNLYISDLSSNYEKYGYRQVKKDSDAKDLFGLDAGLQKYLMWESDITSFNDCHKLAMDAMKQDENMTINGMDAFIISGLGIELKDVLNKKKADINWNEIENVKNQRAAQYKKLVMESLQID